MVTAAAPCPSCGGAQELRADAVVHVATSTNGCPPSREPAATCAAAWDTAHDDPWYGVEAKCDQTGEHAHHEGPAVRWHGHQTEHLDGVRVSWPAFPNLRDRQS